MTAHVALAGLSAAVLAAGIAVMARHELPLAHAQPVAVTASAPVPSARAHPVRRTGSAVLAAAPVVAPPARVTIPAVGVAADLVPLGLDSDGALEVPPDPSVAGWYAGGPTPGEPGPAVLAGHVDSRQGPGVFIDLVALRPGDEVVLTRRDGTLLRFAVHRVEQHPKSDFPTQSVYGPVPGPELRLITCGGSFDRSARHYRDNVVVFAHLAEETTAP